VRGRSAFLIGIACLLACAWAGLGGASAASRSVVCGPASAHTLAADSLARVYSQRGKVYGCAGAGSRSYRLGTSARSFAEGRAGPIALSGVEVAYGLTFYGVDTINAEVLVRKLTDGHVQRQHSAINEPVGAEYFETVDDVVVKSDGSVAWIAHATWIGSQGKSVTEVDKSDRTDQSLLDSSASIDRQSLLLHGSTLSWMDGSSAHSATLS
jgi:hypothetical protein